MHEKTHSVARNMALAVALGLGIGQVVSMVVFKNEGETGLSVSPDELDLAPSESRIQSLRANTEMETIVIDAFDTTVAYWEDRGVELDTSFTLLDAYDGVACGGDLWFGSDPEAVFYCPLDDSVVVSEAFAGLVDIIEPTTAHQKGLVEMVVAHEVGHAVQHASLVSPKSKLHEPQYAVFIELQADCLSGQVLQEAPSKQLDGAEDFFRYLASDHDPSHGTRAQRLDAFSLGNEGGSCTLAELRQAVQE